MVSSGTLPDGLTLSGDGVLSGTPTTAGSATVTIQVADSNGVTASQTYTLAISPPAPLLITSPDGMSVYDPVNNITWLADAAW